MRLCHIDDVPDGDSRGFDPHATGRDTLFVVRRGATLHAYANACPHHGTPMAWRRHAYLDATGERIVCFAHGAQFEIDTGRCTLGPCLGEALTPVPLALHDNGEVHLAQETTS
ncbi:Rieske (2Fe-2S) protein [Ideonella sp. DXS29W]|uniref:Rieske (2Fe-2S) protein n=1 Tax=Ideonella lacteola TaxID=2984193 RepID=A0ABU9BMN1_9BURK